jgi:hypothetical protein
VGELLEGHQVFRGEEFQEMEGMVGWLTAEEPGGGQGVSSFDSEESFHFNVNNQILSPLWEYAICLP